MKKLLILCALLLVPVSTLALDLEKPLADPEDRDYPAGYRDIETDPEVGEGIRKHAEDGQEGPQQNFGIQPIPDNELFYIVRGDRFEYQSKEGDPTLVWDIQAWVGRDYNKLWFKTEGAYLLDEDKAEEVSTELLWSRTIASFWDVQAGIRHDFKPEPTRTFAALGVQGLAPYWFETEMTAYVSEDGDISAKIEFEYDLLFTQRLVLQPRLETKLAVQEVEEYGVGQGINDIVLGLRLRYEFTRKFAPYIGFSWSRKIGDTADLAEAEGKDVETFSFVGGLRFWF